MKKTVTKLFAEQFQTDYGIIYERAEEVLRRYLEIKGVNHSSSSVEFAGLEGDSLQYIGMATSHDGYDLWQDHEELPLECLWSDEFLEKLEQEKEDKAIKEERRKKRAVREAKKRAADKEKAELARLKEKYE